MVGVTDQDLDRAIELLGEVDAATANRGIDTASALGQGEELAPDALVDVEVEVVTHLLQLGHRSSFRDVVVVEAMVREAQPQRSEKARNRMLRTCLMLDEEMVAFLHGGCALIVCTFDEEGAPFASRAWGLTVLCAEGAEGAVRVRLLVTPDVLTEGRIAITATDVPTLRSLQLKGHIADVDAMTEADLAKSEQYIDDFYDDIVSTDHIPRDLLERVRPNQFVVCTVVVEELYDQTPGPRAGASVR